MVAGVVSVGVPGRLVVLLRSERRLNWCVWVEGSFGLVLGDDSWMVEAPRGSRIGMLAVALR